ncbi:DUF6122 family protein [Pontibacter sp. 13R65]|uniref:DUF6122 family protein n=1 Tax=Pontibacter sp. 13R65 TaxID=3127458 RepID=UPI00301BF41E
MHLGFLFHMFLHLVVPLVVAWLFFRNEWKRATLIMLAGILIDLDHLAATPIVDSDRCSVGFHFLHSYWLSAVYVVLAIIPKTRLIGLGLVIHIVLDVIDCVRQGNLNL